MSSKKDREKRREERLAEETKVESKDRRTRLLQFGAGAVFLVVAVVVVLIVIQGSSSDGGGDTKLEDVALVEQQLSGIPQQDLVLGDPEAPVELIEFGDLQCPVCKAHSEEILPPVVEGQVEQGQAKIVFRNFTIIGPQSVPAGAAALAAGAQKRGWNFLDIFYRNQGKENAGYADDEFLTAVAEAAGVTDIPKWNKERAGTKITGEVTKTTAEAQRLGFTGTPSYAVKGPSTNGLELLGNVSSSGELESAINAAS
ncbi:MAG: thioredoxin domain-containing protein [Solirubrobacterales bacterium]